MKRRTGTTVLELVVALVVTAAVAAIGAGAFQQVVDRRRDVLEATRETERAAALRALVREWIAAGEIETPATTRQTAPDDASATASGDALYFTTTALTPARVADARYRLYVDTDDRTGERGLTLAYRTNSNVAWQRKQLDASIDALRIEYLDQTSRRWVAGEEAEPIVALAVRLTFSSGAHDGAALWQLPLTFPITSAGSLPGSTP
ncbi:hypothetical protein [Gemmatimonas sp.]